MSKDDFYSLAVTILLRQKFLNLPLFIADGLESYSISDEYDEASMPLDEFIEELYEELKGILV